MCLFWEEGGGGKDYYTKRVQKSIIFQKRNYCVHHIRCVISMVTIDMSFDGTMETAHIFGCNYKTVSRSLIGRSNYTFSEFLEHADYEVCSRVTSE